MSNLRAGIRAIAEYIPDQKLTNTQLAEDFKEWSAAKIYEKTGITSRGIAKPNECASDLGVMAARRLFDTGVCDPQEIDFLLFCTQSPDYMLPATACVIQPQLGLRTDCGAIDFNQGCSGFIYGLSLAKGLVETEIARNVLLVTAETYSKYINRRDRSVRTIFGDGAAATLIAAFDAESDLIGPFVLGTDGRGATNLIVPAGGARRPLCADTAVEQEDADGNWRSPQNLYMDGPEMFNFTLRVVPDAVEKLLTKCGKTLDEIDYFVLHQANRFMLEHIRGKLRIPPEKFWIGMETCGNTVSSTIPIALASARNRGLILTGKKVMLIGFGVGYSWSAAMVEICF